MDVLNLIDSDQDLTLPILITTVGMPGKRTRSARRRRNGLQVQAETPTRNPIRLTQTSANSTPSTTPVQNPFLRRKLTHAKKQNVGPAPDSVHDPLLTRKLTHAERQNVLDYICKNNLHGSTLNNEMWIALEQSGIAKGRSYITIRNDFRRSVLPQGKLEFFSLSKRNYRVLRKLRPNGKGNQSTESSASVSPVRPTPLQSLNRPSFSKPAKMRSGKSAPSTATSSSNHNETIDLDLTENISFSEREGGEHEVITVLEESSDEEEDAGAGTVQPQNNRTQVVTATATEAGTQVPASTSSAVRDEKEIIDLTDDEEEDLLPIPDEGEIIDIDIADEEIEQKITVGNNVSIQEISESESDEEEIQQMVDVNVTEKDKNNTVEVEEDGEIVEDTDDEEVQDITDEQVQVQPKATATIREGRSRSELDDETPLVADEDEIEIVEMRLNGSGTSGTVNVTNRNRNVPAIPFMPLLPRPARRRRKNGRSLRRERKRYFNMNVPVRSPIPSLIPRVPPLLSQRTPPTSSRTVADALKRLGRSRWGCSVVSRQPIQNPPGTWSERNYQRAHEVVRVRNDKYRRQAYGHGHPPRHLNIGNGGGCRPFPRFMMTHPFIAPPPLPPPLFGDPTGCDRLPVLPDGLVRDPNNLAGGANPNEHSVSAFGMNMYVPPLAAVKGKLRPIVIDGSNVAMSHGLNRVFSCRGIQICAEYFLKLGHETVVAFVPRYRNKPSESVDTHLLDQLENNGVVRFTPSRELNTGVRIASYDDRYVVQCAAAMDGVIVSNDNFRDLLEEQPSWQNIISNRLLQFTWVTGDLIMFPADPLGRNGPPLTEFLRFS